MKHIFISLLFIFIVSATFAQITTNIPYYPPQSPQGAQDTLCLVDIYAPKKAKNLPVVVWFHGGGLRGGSKEIPTALKTDHFLVVGVGYRLSPMVKTVQCIEDAAAATAWVFNNISKYGGDPDKIYLSGHSAGGYLISMIGLDKSYLAHYNIDANRIAGLIPYSGQAITHYENRAEQGIAPLQPVIDKYAPLYHVRADAPPLVIISGDRELELYGRYEENALLWRLMNLVGHKETIIYELDGFNHGTMVHPAHFILLDYLKNKERK